MEINNYLNNSETGCVSNKTLQALGSTLTVPSATGVDVILAELSKTLYEKNTQYEGSVIEALPVEDWLSQIVIKAHRAQLAKSPGKLKDELIDCANYCILLLDKLNNESYGEAV